jgi:hypothetical protein
MRVEAVMWGTIPGITREVNTGKFFLAAGEVRSPSVYP